MRRSARHTLLIAALAFLAWGQTGQVSAGVVIEDYKARELVNGTTTTGLYDPTEYYTVEGQLSVANLLPAHPVELLRGGTPNFLYVLGQMYPESKGWKYVTADQDLSQNSLKVHSYDVRGKVDFVGIEGSADMKTDLGFDVEYVPAAGTKDPTKSVQWIQVVTEMTYSGGQLVKTDEFVDVGNGNINPYYNSTYNADSRNLVDSPGDTATFTQHVWYAETYLVTGGNFPGTVTIYNGIGWGWENHPVPEPSGLMLLGVGAAGFVGWGTLRRKRRSE
jgi:hypothetical protein